MYSQLMGYVPASFNWVPLVCNADGKLIIDPTEIFEDTPTQNEHGKAPTSAWAYNLKGIKYLSIPGNHFDSYRPSTLPVIKSDQGFLIIDDTPIPVVASVFIPHGSTINKAIVMGAVADTTVQWHLCKLLLSTGVFTSIANNLIGAETTLTIPELVDNSLYAYYFYTQPLDTGDIIYGARIIYTV